MSNRQAAAAITAAMLIGLSTAAPAQVRVTSIATVDVCPPISVGVLETPSWGEVDRPTRGTARYKLDYRSNEVTDLAGRGRAVSGGHVGTYSVSGIPAAPISFVVTIGSFSSAGLRAASHVNGATGEGVTCLGWDGNLLLNIGGILEVDSTALIGPQTGVVTVSVDYQ